MPRPTVNGKEMRLKSSLADMDAEIARLHEKGLALKDEAKTRWNVKMADLKAKQEAARKKVDELGKSTGEAWGRLEKGAQSAWDDVQKAFKEASKEFRAGCGRQSQRHRRHVPQFSRCGRVARRVASAPSQIHFRRSSHVLTPCVSRA